MSQALSTPLLWLPGMFPARGISLILGNPGQAQLQASKQALKVGCSQRFFWVKLQGFHETSMLTDLKLEEMDSYKQRATESDALRQQLEATSTSKTAAGSRARVIKKTKFHPSNLDATLDATLGGAYFGEVKAFLCQKQ